MLKEQLDRIMKPKSIAVVGASTKEHTIGSDIMKRLQEYKFTGKIFPINPKGGVIEGLQAYTSVNEVPCDIDLAIIVVNSKFVLSTIDLTKDPYVPSSQGYTFAGFVNSQGNAVTKINKKDALLLMLLAMVNVFSCVHNFVYLVNFIS